MAAALILTAICFAGVLFLVYFFVALCRDAGKRAVLAYVLRLDSGPTFDNTFDGTWNQPFIHLERHHSRRSQRMVPVPLSSQKPTTDSWPASHSTLLRRRLFRAHRRVLKSQ